jgi:hypothetical protein
MHKGPLKYLHGETFMRQDLAMTYLTAVIVTILAARSCIPDPLGMTPKILLAGLFLDTSGGIVANTTESTRQFHASPYQRRVLFIRPFPAGKASTAWKNPATTARWILRYQHATHAERENKDA